MDLTVAAEIGALSIHDLDEQGVILTVRFPWGRARIVPERLFSPKPGDLPTYTYRELKIAWLTKDTRGLRDLYTAKTAFPDTRARGITLG